MDMQKEREALIAEIEVFKAEMLKSYVIKAWADSYVNTDPFSYTIFEDENNKIWWMKAQAYELWQMWQSAKSQSVTECVWAERYDGSVFESSCGHTFELSNDGKLDDNNMKHCCFCGGKIEAQEQSND